MNVKLDFGNLVLEADLFESEITNKFIDNLPYEIDLTKWGHELYGSIGIDLGTDNPNPEIPEGGLAYTNNGNYFCVFFGQQPAWAVEYIGQIKGDKWKKLLTLQEFSKLKIYQ